MSLQKNHTENHVFVTGSYSTDFILKSETKQSKTRNHYPFESDSIIEDHLDEVNINLSTPLKIIPNLVYDLIKLNIQLIQCLIKTVYYIDDILLNANK